MKWFKHQRQTRVQEIPTDEFWFAVDRVLDAYYGQEYDRYSELPEKERSGHLYESWRVIGKWLNTATDEEWWPGPDTEID